MNAIIICDMLASRLDNELILKAKVHSVFKNACNLITPHDELITILNSDKKIYPMTVVIDGKGNMDFTTINMVQGSEFILHRERIFSVDTGLCIYINKAKRWNSEPDLNFKPISYKDIKENINALEKGIELYGKFSIMAPLVMSLEESCSWFKTNMNIKDELEEKYRFIFNRFQQFIDLIIKNKIDEISCFSKKLIGFGVGLTPSMDDFISGFMISLIYLTKYYGFALSDAYKINFEIISKGLEGTTRVSSEMLRFSALGKSSQLIKNLILSLLCETQAYRILQKVKEAVEIGETSGTDTVFGVYVAFKIADRIMFNCEKATNQIN